MIHRQDLIRIIEYAILLIIICISFFLYSSQFFPLLNSDDGVTILMIHDFNFKTDLYFWGQDRYGSILPLVGQFFHKGLGFSCVLSESFSHYLIISLGFFSLVSFLKDYKLKIALALVWFFPPFHMLDFLRNTLGIEYSLICISLYFIKKTYTVRRQNNKRLLFYFLSMISLSFALWVSDLAVVTILLIVLFAAAYKFFFSGKKSLFRWDADDYKYLLITAFTLIATIIFIIVAKRFSEKSVGYFGLANLAEMKASAGRTLISLKEILLFQANEPGTSFYCYGIFFLIVLIITGTNLFKIDVRKELLILFFLTQAAALLIAVLISNWAYQCEVGRRYFVSVYAAFWTGLLLMIDSEKPVYSRVYTIQILLLFVTLLTGGLGAQYNIRKVWPGTPVPTVRQLEDFKNMGNIGIVANYWNSYLIACTDPDHIVATPHQGDNPRNKKLIPEVFSQDSIIVIRDGWLEEFPEYLNQFGYRLKRAGEEQFIDGCYTCKYDLIEEDVP